MKQALKLFPSLATTLLLFVLPLVFSAYFVITRFSDKFIAEQNITYFDVQYSLVGKFFVTQAWLDWFNRFMDFALWGMFGAVVLIIAWSASSARIAVDNHKLESRFRNFNQSTRKWHEKFIVTAVIKIAVVISMVVVFFSLLGQALPLLAMNIATGVQSLTPSTLLPILYTIFYSVFLQFLFVTLWKTFRAIRMDT